MKKEVSLSTRFEELRFRNRDPLFVGIDPGSTGAIAFLQSGRCLVIDIPTMKIKRGKGKKTEPNYQDIVTIFRRVRIKFDTVHVCLERPNRGFGKGGHAYAQAAVFGSYMMWPLFLLSKDFSLEEVQPNVWKKAMKVGKDKEDVRHKALKMFPRAEITRKRDHNRAEALLLAEYLRRLHSGKGD